MKSGTVLLIGRPNVGKSTFVNNLIGQKVAITSPKPQTTRFPIQAFYEDERGQIIFVDTPGVFDKTKDMLAKKINLQTEHALKETVDVVLYMVDHTRRRDFEEAKVLGMVRKMNKPTLLIVNKTDLQEKTYLPQYEFLKDEFPEMFKISALNKTHVDPLLARLFELLPEGKQVKSPSVYPALNIDSKTFLSELIREKIFLKTGEEIPYSASVVIDEVTERENKVTYIKARILTTKNRYKKMLVGAGGKKIKELGTMSRKEIELATGKKIFLDLTVETDPHWQEVLH
ncbi:GTPase Era [Candidatus Roizmanbacteria bacterium RIFCSPLOWO2_12_FULL_40_12]|uniref:GTPase Era n=1 Tax=Candidatus Roizmanbacteria bacterium RIFCSPLOWO2_01_FULL_40_42 TaxID=1802066 RepID=A0A1F7J5Z1_9BACT|nr:MAG: GTPase Era [Candidatus Roizmanbacteria bacterium RIFCSPHIGHO2_01_FULL_40_98]OGK27849.1 MAG: GTPase Era [Candidatus Roizmanbacteria bacterium RIFCSPHIGHO2_02_FULL_40_53]OGK29399.1 MAG: GTPase Era [Candidatus Roizmanbacteria bacterium RIFCSPHIGHO2_12_41_18]OGK51040.1 MAG: GTPase Era [Candidatus Roizmanbacteria bacterium RIFCSPLOWO2_01_FULL_40_42]OGK59113.1 MAG: GTPase Era [Candidatus Roizmanbacteria bacterium RIFCSPLOWO2_02_FULL_40_13]OGK61683.1 MAG: GTPase Era [Candidatus Roizmanbacteri